MSEINFTIAGTNHHQGQEFIEPDMSVKLIKEPDNEVDSETINIACLHDEEYKGQDTKNYIV